MMATAYGDLDVVKDLVARGADVNATESYGQTTSNQAGENSKWEAVKYLTCCHVSGNAAGNDIKTTFLMAAAV